MGKEAPHDTPPQIRPATPTELLDQLLAGNDASAASDQGGLIDSPQSAP
jgi:hypothetical protein